MGSMKELSEIEFWIAIGLAFVVGYVVVSFLSRLMKTEPPPPPSDPFRSPSTAAAEASSAGAGQDLLPAEQRQNLEVLGLSAMPGAAELDQAYQTALAKVHPDHVAHLDVEFRELAERKRTEIEVAYALLRTQIGSRPH